MMRGLLASADPEAIRRKADDVFSRPEFNPTRPWFDFPQWFIDFFRWIGKLGSTAPYIFWALLIASIIALILIIIYVVRSTIRSSTFGLAGGSRTRAERMRQSAGHFEMAGECAERGEYTEAIRHLFLSLVFRFDEAGRVVLRPAATNREYLRLLDERLPERREISTFVDFLDDFWYGQRNSDRAHYEQSLSTYERLVR